MNDLNEQHQKLMDEALKPFIKAFNAGYLLNKHEPELLETILKTPNQDKPYLQAMKEGKKQHEKDKFVEQIKQEQQKSRDKEIEK